MDEIQRLQGMRAHFIATGDPGMAAEVDVQLDRLGVRYVELEVEDLGPPELERAVSHTPPVKRGKQR